MSTGEALFESAQNQHRIRGLVTGLTRIVFSPRVQELLDADDIEDDGWGMSHYRYAPGLVTPDLVPGQKPVEIDFFPTLGELDIVGGIFWHGEGSRELEERGKLLGFHLDEEIVDKKYVNHLIVVRRQDGLEVGHPVADRVLLPPTESLIADVEIKIDTLLDRFC